MSLWRLKQDAIINQNYNAAVNLKQYCERFKITKVERD
jgi:hypothetical protein